MKPDDRRWRILIVDDVSSNRKLIKRCAQQLGFDCDEAEDGAEAVEMWKVAELGSKKQESNNAQGQGEGEWQGPSGSKIDQAYALVLMDNVMPNMTGVQATQKIRALEAADFGGSGHSSSDSINSMWMSQPAMPPKRRTMIFGLTGNALSEDVAEFKSAGCDEVSQAVRRFSFIFNTLIYYFFLACSISV